MKDADFKIAEAVRADVIAAYNTGGDVEPNPNDLRLDLAGKATSLWNIQVSRILLKHLKEDQALACIIPSDDFILDILSDRFKTLIGCWRDGQLKRKANGNMETSEELEIRMTEQDEMEAKRCRRVTRRLNVSIRPTSRV